MFDLRQGKEEFKSTSPQGLSNMDLSLVDEQIAKESMPNEAEFTLRNLQEEQENNPGSPKFEEVKPMKESKLLPDTEVKALEPIAEFEPFNPFKFESEILKLRRIPQGSMDETYITTSERNHRAGSSSREMRRRMADMDFKDPDIKLKLVCAEEECEYKLRDNPFDMDTKLRLAEILIEEERRLDDALRLLEGISLTQPRFN